MNGRTQGDFASALLDPAQSRPRGLRGQAGSDVARRFAVHRNNTLDGLVDALAAAFPVTLALVGEDFFRAMAKERVRIDPPRSPILVDYGDGFAEFIANFAPAAGIAYLADIARLERLRVRAYHAADADPLAADAYRALVAAPARLAATRLRLHPACAWLGSRHAVYSIWNAHQGLSDLGEADLATIDSDAPEEVLITRPQWDVQVTLLPAGSCAWLEALRAGRTLTEALSGTDDDEDGARLMARLAVIVGQGIAIELEPPQRKPA